MSKLIPWRSLRTRVTVLTLCVFLISIWTLAFFSRAWLREDMQTMLGERQFSTVSIAADQVNEGLVDRMHALQAVADEHTSDRLDDSPALQTHLERHRALLGLFNGGVFMTDARATVVADAPLSAKRLGINYMDRGAFSAALKLGKVGVGRPVLGKALKTPVFSMVVPIRNHKGEVIGTLAGVINLGIRSFVDKIAEHSFGAGGGFILMAPEHGIIVTATDKSRMLQALPPTGVNTMLDRYLQGFEGHGFSTNSAGIAVISSAKAIPAAQWVLIATEPLQAAFAPIAATQNRLIVAALLMTLLAVALTWLVVRRQLLPLTVATSNLVSRSVANLPLEPLPVSSHDEVGELVSGFNHLLSTLGEREARLRRSEASVRAIIDSVDAEIAVLDSAGVIVEMNQPWRQSVQDHVLTHQGHTLPADIGRNYLWSLRADSTGMSEAQATTALEGIESVLKGQQPRFIMEYTVDLADGPHWFHLVASPLGADQPGLVISRTDITGHVQARQAQVDDQAMFAQFIDHLPAAAFVTDLTGKFLHVNSYAQQFVFGANTHELDHRADFNPFAMQRMALQDRRALKGGYQTIEEEVLGANGTVGVYQSHLFLIERQGRVPLMGCIALDITERKHMDGELIAAKQSAERANNAKTRFLAAASHDLRQPLAALSLYVEVLQTKATPDTFDLFHRIAACSANLSRLLNDLLEVSKLDAGVVTPALTRFALDPFMDNLVAQHLPEADRKHLHLRWRSSGRRVFSDPALLQRMVGNLLTNAIRYTEHGGVLMGCRQHDGRTWLEVWDTGMGIASDKLEVIFEEFSQIESHGSPGGSGLGLAIVAKTAALLGLQIRVRSRPGRGSMFAIELRAGRESAQPAQPAQPAQRLRIALADDNAEVLHAVVMALENAGHEVVAAASGAALLWSLGDVAPDILITDYRLSEHETGIDLVDAARAKFGAELPAFIITGDTDPALIRSMTQKGVAILYKPLQMDNLLAYVRALTGREA